MNSRRSFLGRAATFTALAPLAPSSLFADTRSPVKKGRTLVVVFLRGGIDGLNLIVPHGDKHYYEHRKRIAIPRPGSDPKSAIDLDGFFGLHPAAKNLAPVFESGICRALHAVGYAQNSRSHFEEQDTWETGVIGNTISSDGWLNRHLHSTSGHGTIRAVSIGNNLPRILRGRAPAYSIRSVGDLAMPQLPGDPDAVAAALREAYCEQPDNQTGHLHELMARTASSTLDGARQLKELAETEYQPRNGVSYEKTPISKSFQEAARLIRADIGTEVIEIDYGGWDTHNNQGGSDGPYANRLAALADALATFATDLDEKMKDVMLLTLSDFGRTAKENGNRGTDHGWANCMLALGGATMSPARKKSPVGGAWPGLAPEQLHQDRDLSHTTDFRDVIGDAISAHLGNTALEYILPNHQHQPTDLLA